jgi:hypothetical protein
MATGVTAVYGLSYPLLSDPVNIHGDIKTLADQLDLLFAAKASSGLSNTFTQPNVFDIGSSSTAVRISQTGTGNALLVEDSANPDSTPFVIDASGNVGIGKLSPAVLLDVAGVGAFSGALTASTFNALSLTSNTTGFAIAGGTTSKTLTINNTITLAGTDGTTITLPATSGTVALNNQQFYIGTQAITINQGTGTITSLPGVSSINGTTIPSAATLTTSTSTFNLGTTSIALNRTSASQTLTGISIDGNAGTVTNGIYTTTTSLPNVTSVNSTTIPSAATLLTSTSTTSALTSFGSGPTISLPVIENIKIGYTTTATAAGTTTLTSASNFKQYFTGATTQTIVLPAVTTLALGMAYEINNNSTGTLTVQSSGLNTITTIPAGLAATFTVILTTGTTAASWDYEFSGFNTITGTGSVVLSASPTFTGTPLSTTAAVDTNTTQIATTAYVVGQGYAKLASPTLTGTPAAPTATANTNTTQIATTAYVIGQGNATAGTIAMNGIQAAGVSNLYARADHVHPSDTAKANLASPSFTGTVSMSGPLFMSGGVTYLYQPTITTISTTGANTLTIAQLLTEIINYTGAGTATFTLPTGTLMDGGITGIVSNVAFDWSVVNTTGNAVTMASGTSNTYVGNTTVAANVSARFRSVRTAATTWSTYRIS